MELFRYQNTKISNIRPLLPVSVLKFALNEVIWYLFGKVTGYSDLQSFTDSKRKKSELLH